ncbi:TPA: hypothetical protein TVL50_001820 [Streptococcus equi subsp. zooepidemicus]|nr:hypothetical protein [Streptococcus equi subsp. zooepidemicus]
MGYDNAPYKPGTPVYEIELSEDTMLVWVYDGEVSGQYGGWLMRYEDVEGLTSSQIKNRFALPATPKYITDVIVSRGTALRMGIVNPLEGWGEGQGIQFDLMGQRTGNFTNERLIGDKVK